MQDSTPLSFFLPNTWADRIRHAVGCSRASLPLAHAKGGAVLPEVPLVPEDTLLMGPQVPGTNGTSGPRKFGPAIRISKDETLLVLEWKLDYLH